MLVSQNAMLDSTAVINDMTAEAQRWELKVLTGQKNLVALKERLQQQLEQWTKLRAERQNLVSEVLVTQSELEKLTQDSAARKTAIEKLRAELAALDKESQALTAAAAKPSDDGTRLRAFEGEGNRQYLTGLRMGGKHVVILVDASAQHARPHDRERDPPPQHAARAAAPGAEVEAGREYGRLAHDADPARHADPDLRVQRQGDVGAAGHATASGSRSRAAASSTRP